jgi:hypothetical protein
LELETQFTGRRSNLVALNQEAIQLFSKERGITAGLVKGVSQGNTNAKAEAIDYGVQIYMGVKLSSSNLP